MHLRVGSYRARHGYRKCQFRGRICVSHPCAVTWCIARYADTSAAHRTKISPARYDDATPAHCGMRQPLRSAPLHVVCTMHVMTNTRTSSRQPPKLYVCADGFLCGCDCWPGIAQCVKPCNLFAIFCGPMCPAEAFYMESGAQAFCVECCCLGNTVRQTTQVASQLLAISPCLSFVRQNGPLSRPPTLGVLLCFFFFKQEKLHMHCTYFHL